MDDCIGIHHKQFDGLAALKVGEKLIRYNMCILFFSHFGGYSNPFFEGSGLYHGGSSDVLLVEC